jgi:ferredoxin
MKLVIDTNLCSGHGRCYVLAPELFKDDDSGYGQVRTDSVDPALIDKARLAVASCPERAISLAEG